MLEAIFERFEQGDRASQGGLGLGLYLVRALVGRLGGSVLAASGGPKKGATFTIVLPRLRR